MSNKGFLIWMAYVTITFWVALSLGYYYGGKNKAKKLIKEFEEKQKSVPSSATYRTSPLFPPPAI